MSLTLTFTPTLQAIETLENTVLWASADKQLLHAITDLSLALNGASTPAVTKIYADQMALVAGAKTLDMTSLLQAGSSNGTQDMTGLKLRFGVFRNPSANTGNMTVKFGAANAYQVFGDASGRITLRPGHWSLNYYSTNHDAVAAAVKNIDISGTGTEKLDIWLVFG